MSGSGTDKTKSGHALTGPIVILVEPQLGENIGMAARAMGNFGLTRLRIVNPRDGWPNVHARRAASGADHILDDVELFDTVEQAVADCSLLFATTARAHDQAKPVVAPEAAAREVLLGVARRVEALRLQQEQQERDRQMAGDLWQESGLVFASTVGTPLNANNVIRAFRLITKKAGLGEDWVPREMRHTFVSVMSASGVPVESIALLVVTTARPRLGRSTATRSSPRSPQGAEVMDEVFRWPRRSGGEACGGGPGSVDVDDLAVEAVLVQVAARRLDPARGS